MCSKYSSSHSQGTWRGCHRLSCENTLCAHLLHCRRVKPPCCFPSGTSCYFLKLPKNEIRVFHSCSSLKLSDFCTLPWEPSFFPFLSVGLLFQFLHVFPNSCLETMEALLLTVILLISLSYPTFHLAKDQDNYENFYKSALRVYHFTDLLKLA